MRLHPCFRLDNAIVVEATHKSPDFLCCQLELLRSLEALGAAEAAGNETEALQHTKAVAALIRQRTELLEPYAAQAAEEDPFTTQPMEGPHASPRRTRRSAEASGQDVSQQFGRGARSGRVGDDAVAALQEVGHRDAVGAAAERDPAELIH